MKTILSIAVVLLIFSACQKQDTTDNSLTTTWQLIEILADPGDGSGTFQPTTSSKTMTFHSNGTVSSNESLCSFGGAGTPTTGVYDTTSVPFTMDSLSCDSNPSHLPFSVRFEYDNNELLVYYPCIEPCIEKYIRQ